MSLSTRLSLKHKAALCSLAVLTLLIIIWQAATLPDAPPAESKTAASAEATEYAMLMGKIPETGAAGSAPAKVTGFPTPAQFAEEASKQFAHPFHDNGPNDKGFGIQMGYSLATRVFDVQPLYPGTQTDLAPCLDADRALHHQEFIGLRRVRDFYLFRLADADQHSVRRGGGPP